MNKMIAVLKKDFIKKYETEFRILSDDFGSFEFDHIRTSLEEVFTTVSEKHDDEIPLGFPFNYNNYQDSIDSIRKMAIVSRRIELISGIRKLEGLYEDFPFYKKVLYSLNIGDNSKIEHSRKNAEILKNAQAMLDGKLDLPKSLFYTIPDEFQISEFIPELGQSFFNPIFEMHNNMKVGVEEYKVTSINFSDDFYIKRDYALKNLDQEEVIPKINKSNVIYVSVTLTSVHSNKTIRLANREILTFNGERIKRDNNSLFFTNKENAVEHVHSEWKQASSLIENNLKNI